jgi:site-specific DNA-methyltransferase (adenine-specific)
VDLLILDPPYNRSKAFNGQRFTQSSIEQYERWLDDMLRSLVPLLKPTATVYICGDWYTSTSIFIAASKHFQVRNRICWEREKGRGAKTNWKNTCEDIWFCTMSNSYTFRVDRVKTRRPVIAPYTDSAGQPKDWIRHAGGAYRDTHPSNFWTDITVPFWSMPENTEHPTQKSEKLIARLVLASTDAGDFILDPFHGSGTTAVVAKKLERRCLGIELDEDYCLLAAKRWLAARPGDPIQGYHEGVFWPRNS